MTTPSQTSQTSQTPDPAVHPVVVPLHPAQQKMLDGAIGALAERDPTFQLVVAGIVAAAGHEAFSQVRLVGSGTPDGGLDLVFTPKA